MVRSFRSFTLCTSPPASTDDDNDGAATVAHKQTTETKNPNQSRTFSRERTPPWLGGRAHVARLAGGMVGGLLWGVSTSDPAPECGLNRVARQAESQQMLAFNQPVFLVVVLADDVDDVVSPHVGEGGKYMCVYLHVHAFMYCRTPQCNLIANNYNNTCHMCVCWQMCAGRLVGIRSSHTLSQDTHYLWVYFGYTHILWHILWVYNQTSMCAGHFGMHAKSHTGHT